MHSDVMWNSKPAQIWTISILNKCLPWRILMYNYSEIDLLQKSLR